MNRYPTTHTEETRRISTQAAEWLRAMKENPDEQTRTAFTAWVTLSQQHLQEFLLITMLDRQLSGAGALAAFDVEKIVAEAKRGGTVVKLEEHTRPIAPPSSPGRQKAGRSAWRWAAAASVAAIAGALWWQSPMGSGHSREYRTDTGEQRTFELEDGSIIELNADSRLRVRYSAQTRELRLLEGEALFKVARDPARPFYVRTDRNTVQAVGTQFNINRRQSGVTVSVLEGRVRISADKDEAPTLASANLSAGEEVRIAPDGKITHRAALDTVRATSWRQRRLSFHGETLADIAEEFNRYNDRHIQVEDAAARARRFNGVFDANDPASFVEFLERNSQLQIVSGADGFTIRTR